MIQEGPTNPIFYEGPANPIIQEEPDNPIIEEGHANPIIEEGHANKTFNRLIIRTKHCEFYLIYLQNIQEKQIQSLK